VVAVVVDRVAAVGGLLPHVAGEELVLGLAGPVGVALGVAQVQALDFLQEHHVGPQQAQPVAQVVDGEPPVELGEALVDVVGADAQGGHGGSFFYVRHSARFGTGGDRLKLRGGIPVCRRWRMQGRPGGGSHHPARSRWRQARRALGASWRSRCVS
jgi:hypothetical protein